MEYVQHKNTKAEEAAKSTSPSSATTTSQTLTHTIAFTTQPKSIAFTTNKNRTPHRGPRTSDDAKTGPPPTMNPNFTSVHTNMPTAETTTTTGTSVGHQETTIPLLDTSLQFN
jgi:hypothetical protein